MRAKDDNGRWVGDGVVEPHEINRRHLLEELQAAKRRVAQLEAQLVAEVNAGSQRGLEILREALKQKG